MTKLNFKNCEDNDYEVIYLSQAVNYGEGAITFAIRLTYLDEVLSADECDSKYLVEIHAVSPAFAGLKNVKSALESSWDIKEGVYPFLKKCEIKDKAAFLAYELMRYGTSACLWSKQGNNKTKLLAEARKEATILEAFTIGLALDKCQNMIGNTGWDFMRGQIGYKAAV